MKYHYHTLKNGLRVGIVPMKEAGIVTIIFMVNAGSRFDQKEHNGVAHFTEHMLFKGTKKRPQTAQIEREIEQLGGIFNAFTTKEFTWFSIKLLKKDIELALDVLSDMLTEPLLLEEQIIKERRVILEELHIFKDSPSDIVDDLFYKCLYHKDPLAHPIVGIEKSIRLIRREHILAFFKKYYCAKNTALTIAGDIEDKDCLKLAQRFFSKMPVGIAIKDGIIKRDSTGSKVHFKHRPSEQVYLAVGVPAYSIKHPDHHACKIIALLLGGNMSTRLFMKLREELGLVYDVMTVAEAKKNSGYLVTYTGVEKKHLEKTIELIIAAYKRLKNEPVAQKELTDAKNFLIDKKKISFEDSSLVAMDIAKRIIFDKNEKNVEDYQKEINKITPDDLLRVARKIFTPKKLNIAMVGPISSDQVEKIERLSYLL
ncbi:MAG: pitrilysin family protein [Parcubacteria group bacterium]